MDPAEVTRLPLGRLIAVQPVDAREFVDWESLRSYVHSYAQRTNQLYVEHSTVDVSTHNAEMLQSDPEEPPVPGHLAVFSQVFGCIHGSERPTRDLPERKQSRSSQHWINTRCTAQIHAHVTRDWQDHWRVVIADQFAYHNHRVPDSLGKRYAETAATSALPSKAQEAKSKRPKKRRRKRKSPQQQPEATEAIKIAEQAAADVAADQDTSDSDWAAQKKKPMKGFLGPNANTPSGDSDVDAAADDDGELDRSEPHVDAAEVPERDCRVHPMRKITFKAWAELDAYLDEYSRPSHQIYTVDQSTSASQYNADIKKNGLSQDNLIPQRIGFYERTWKCTAASSTSARDCPAMIRAKAKRYDVSGRWQVVISDQIVLHNHPVAKTLLKPRATYAAHRNRIMKLHFQGVTIKDIMQDIRQHSDIEPHHKGIWSLISRLKRDGWTAESCEEESKEDKTLREHEDCGAGEDERREFIPLVHEDKHVEIVVISSDEEESCDQSDEQQHQRTISTRSQSAHNNHKASISRSDNNADESDLDPCASNDEADEAVEIDHHVRVCPIQQRSFDDWEELGEYLTAYSRSTYQVYCVRSTCNVRSRNAEISRTKSGRRENLVPEHFEAYVKRWDCFHDNGTGKWKRNVFKCPAKIYASVKKEEPSGVWRVVITKHIAVHSHHVNENIFKSCCRNQQISDPRVLAEVMNLHYGGATSEEIMVYVDQHADISLSLQGIDNLIKKLKRNGWTQEIASAGEEKPKRGTAHASGSVEDRNDLDSKSKDPDNGQKRRLRSARHSKGNPSRSL